MTAQEKLEVYNTFDFGDMVVEHDGFNYEFSEREINNLVSIKFNYGSKSVTEEMKSIGWGTDKRQAGRKAMREWSRSDKNRELKNVMYGKRG